MLKSVVDDRVFKRKQKEGRVRRRKRRKMGKRKKGKKKEGREGIHAVAAQCILKII